MAPNPKVKEAFCAMKAIGITEEKVKPVLKNLLRVYEKNWELIEAENYRALADAIFDSEDSKLEEQKKTEDEVDRKSSPDGETERPLKRLKKGSNESPSSHHETQSPPRNVTASPLTGNSRVISHAVADQPLTRYKGKQLASAKPSALNGRPDSSNNEGTHVSHPSSSCRPTVDSISFVMRLRNKRKQTLNPPDVSGEKTERRDNLSHAIRIEDQSDDLILPTQMLPISHSLVKSKDEPFIIDLDEPIPICSIGPASESFLQVNGSGREQVTHTPIMQAITEQRNGGVFALATESRANNIPLKDSEKSLTRLKIGSTQCGRVNINLSYDMDCQRPEFRVPNLEEVLETVSAKYRKMFKILDSGFSLSNVMEDVCNSFLGLGNESGNPKKLVETHELLNTELDSPGASPETFPLGIGVQAEQDDSVPTNCQTSIVRRNQRSNTSDVDIAKGQENIVISLVNDVNKERPPLFHYIPQNAIYQHAYVSVSLARIGNKNCCSSCSVDCLSLSSPCACAHEIGGDFAYTKDGLVKEKFLKECISMNRAPEKHRQYFCKECPLERAKCEDIIEPCKGHLVRKFIKECWWKCGCGKQCGNRVVQRGIRRKLQVFMTPEGKGWGLRTLEDLPKGSFVCEYVGEVLTNAELFERVEQRQRKGERHSYPVLLDADWSSEGVLKDEEALCLDATTYGNVARFINHRCDDANMVEIPVEIETPDHHYYHLAFFTSRKVRAMEEMTWDYGIDFDDIDHPVKAFSCNCGSKYCRNIKRTRRTRSSTRR